MGDERFEEALGSLYAGPPEDFVAARNTLVRQLRGEGERELATRVAALRRPSVSLWLANRLHEVAPDRLNELLAAGGELQQAQAEAASGDAASRRRFRELIARHAQLIDELVRAGLTLAEEHGHGAGEEVGRRLAATLRAASTDGDEKEDARRLLHGRLQAELEPAGFESIGLLAPAAPPEGGRRAAESPAEAAVRAAEARRLAAEKERAAIVARTRADELGRQADALAKQARSARQEADVAEQEAQAAEAEAAAARAEAENHR